MIDRNRELYRITVGEHRATRSRCSTIAVRHEHRHAQGRQHRDHPVMDVGIPGRERQIGAGFIRALLECFEAAAAAYCERYG